MKKFHRGFTIVELLVVIVVIGILATIVFAGYSSISQRAATASVQSDLAQSKKQIEAFYAINGVYPTANSCLNTLATEICLKASTGNTLIYTPSNTINPTSYTLFGRNNFMSYTLSNDSLLSGLVGWYRMKGDASDSSGNGNNGTLVGPISLTQNNFGTADSAYNFDGSTSYVSLSNNSGLPWYSDSGQFSIAFWMKPSASAATSNTIYAEGNSGTTVPLVQVFVTQTYTNVRYLQISVRNNLATWVMLALSTNGISDDSAWRHATLVINQDAGTVTFYINGVQHVVRTYTPASMGAVMNRFSIGARTRTMSDNFFSGSLSDLRLYKRALSTAEIQTLASTSY